ncbi:hypothetical protein OU798_02075 [Prolixibacteraceae bacterium Z1-6]|uniref:HTH cro/C1-type domain-containing protein n=1 Tax=Draconibacterium aestuarii TaxID=2998507 RepID=A0A9X3J4Q7_9BACT|nr:hypothetical protein [Prolixibacteraceae bacterium Z1-6]
MDYNKRIIDVVEEKNMTASAFADKIDATRQAVYNWKKGTHNIPIKYVIEFLKQFEDVDARWVLTGLRKENAVEDEAHTKLLEEHEQLIAEVAELKKQMFEYMKQLLQGKDELLVAKDEILRLKS